MTEYEVHYGGWHIVLHLLSYFAPMVMLAVVILVAGWRGGRWAGRLAALVATAVVAGVYLWPMVRFARMASRYDLHPGLSQDWLVFNGGSLLVVWVIMVMVALAWGGGLRRKRLPALTPRVFG